MASTQPNPKHLLFLRAVFDRAVKEKPRSTGGVPRHARPDTDACSDLYVARYTLEQGHGTSASSAAVYQAALKRLQGDACEEFVSRCGELGGEE